MIQAQNNALYPEEQWQSIYNYAQLHPHIYAAFTALAALLGYSLLLLFPVLFITGAWQTIALQTGQYSTGNVIGTLFWLGVTVFSALITMQLSKLSFKHIEGIALTSPVNNNIRNLLDKIATQTLIPRVDNIVISEQISIDLVKIPRYPLPIWSVNTLVIGLPLMQCLSPEYFECAVVRKLLQHSKQKAGFLKWMQHLRSTWTIYSLQFATKRNLSHRVLAPVFHLYSKFYRDLAVPIANRVELMADQNTLSIVNDEDLLQTIEKVIVTKIFMDKEYWPRIAKLQKQGLTLSLAPYSNLENTLKDDLSNKSAKRWLDSLYEHESHRMHALPSLRSRMNNIGRNRVRIPEKTQETAAQYYLDNSYSEIITGINQLWLQRNSRMAATGRLSAAAQSKTPPLNTALSQPYRVDVLQ